MVMYKVMIKTSFTNESYILCQCMGELTIIAKESTNFASLRTVIFMFIVKQWQLKKGDKLEWQIES